MTLIPASVKPARKVAPQAAPQPVTQLRSVPALPAVDPNPNLLARIAELEGSLATVGHAQSETAVSLQAEIESLESALSESDTARRQETARVQAVIAELESSLAVSTSEAEKLKVKEAERQTKMNAIPRWMTRVDKWGTGFVLAAVGVQVYWGGFQAAYHEAKLPIGLALLIPFAIEAGAAVELTSLVKHKILGIKSHWTQFVLPVGLLGLSVAGMLIHAREAHSAWANTLAVALPIELALVVRAALITGKPDK
jgi:hypothetical protein